MKSARFLGGRVALLTAAIFTLAPWTAAAEHAEQTASETAHGQVVETASGDCPTTTLCIDRPQDEFWVVSTRHLGCPACGYDVPLGVHRLEAGLWTAADLSLLTTGADPTYSITLIYLHGNRVDASQAVRQGRMIYRKLASYAPDEVTLRFVVWSWPSEQIHGQLRDIRAKAVRTNAEGYYLGWFLAQFDPHVPVSVLGYSYGARIATGGLHVLGGGRVAGCALASPPLRSPVRTVLFAAALDRCWITPGGAHGNAMSQIDELLLLYNNCDPVLKRYAMVEKGYHPAALGYQGIAPISLGAAAGKLEQYNTCSVVGKSHEEFRYLRSPWLIQLMAGNLLWHSDEAL